MTELAHIQVTRFKQDRPIDEKTPKFSVKAITRTRNLPLGSLEYASKVRIDTLKPRSRLSAFVLKLVSLFNLHTPKKKISIEEVSRYIYKGLDCIYLEKLRTSMMASQILKERLTNDC